MDTVKIDRPFYKLYAWQALEKWGEPAQLDMVIEECLELALAVRHYKRGRFSQPREVILDEMVDVLLMIDQLREIFLISGKELGEKRSEKIVRLCTRMETE